MKHLQDEQDLLETSRLIERKILNNFSKKMTSRILAFSPSVPRVIKKKLEMPNNNNNNDIPPTG